MPGRGRRRFLSIALTALLVAFAAPSRAPADGGRGSRGDVRVSTACGSGARAELRVREREDDLLRIELELSTPQRGSRWSLVIVHERRLVFSGRVRVSGGSIAVRRTVRDWFGEDHVVARATGPSGTTCRLAGTVAGGS
jgi:hypothetical protein